MTDNEPNLQPIPRYLVITNGVMGLLIEGQADTIIGARAAFADRLSYYSDEERSGGCAMFAGDESHDRGFGTTAIPLDTDEAGVDVARWDTRIFVLDVEFVAGHDFRTDDEPQVYDEPHVLAKYHELLGPATDDTYLDVDIPTWESITNFHDVPARMEAAWTAVQERLNPGGDREPCSHCGRTVIYDEVQEWVHPVGPGCWLHGVKAGA